MARSALIDVITRTAEPLVSSMGLVIWGLEILQAGRPVVRLYVDAPHGENVRPAMSRPQGAQNGGDASAERGAALEAVTIDQCAHISRVLGLALEVEEIFSAAYVLEVSSPGLSRTFFSFEQLGPYVGDTLEATLSEASDSRWPGRKKFRGVLRSAVDGRLVLALEDAAQNGEEGPCLLDVAWDMVRKAVRVHMFHEPEKPGRKKRVQ